MNIRYNSCLYLAGTLAVFASVWSASAGATAPAGRYVTTNVTVFDTKTKLTWQRTLGPYLEWVDAKAYCASPSTSTSLGGSTWRLPTVKELQSLVDVSVPSSFVDPVAFPTVAFAVWSSTLFVASPATEAWYVNFDNGASAAADNTSGTLGAFFSVLCVH